jgi:protein SCO1/2
MNRREFFGGVIGAAVSGSTLLSGPLASEAIEQSCLPELTAGEKRRRRRFPNIVLRTHENKEVRFYDDLIKDKTVLFNVMYTVCRGEATCPLTTANLVKVQKALGARVGRDIFIYSITLDPEHDTPKVLKRYAKSFGVGPGWLFLTGKKADIERLRRTLGFVNSDPVLDKDRSQHIGMVRYGIEPLERWEACPALTKPESIARYVSWLEPKGRGALQGQQHSSERGWV